MSLPSKHALHFALMIILDESFLMNYSCIALTIYLEANDSFDVLEAIPFSTNYWI